jgi:hypothetical protein
LPSTTAVRNPALTYAASSTPGGTRFSRRSIRKASSPAGGFSRSFTWRVRGPAAGRVSVRVCVHASVRAYVCACVCVCGDRSRTSWIPAMWPLGMGGGIRRVRLVWGEGRGASGWYGGRGAACRFSERGPTSSPHSSGFSGCGKIFCAVRSATCRAARAVRVAADARAGRGRGGACACALARGWAKRHLGIVGRLERGSKTRARGGQDGRRLPDKRAQRAGALAC